MGCGEGKFMEVCSLNFDMILGNIISVRQKRGYAQKEYEFGLKQILESFRPVCHENLDKQLKVILGATQILADSSKQILSIPISNPISISQSFLSV